MDESGVQQQAGALIRNREALLEHGLPGVRAAALSVAEAGLAACDPGRAVERLVDLDGGDLVIGGRRRPLPPSGRLVVLGAGKASLEVVLALEAVLGDRLEGGIVSVRRGEAFRRPVRTAVIQAGHPLPDDASFNAAESMLELAEELGPADVLLACFTGGSSALASLPPAGVGFDEKRDLHERLLSAGLPIGQVNAVRKQVSAFKGGRLARAAAPAAIVNLTVSDVAGDRLDVLTDPSVQDLSTSEDACEILRTAGLWDKVAPSIRMFLEGPEAGTPDLSGADVEATLLVTGATACQAMADAAAGLGFEPEIVGTDLEGEARLIGRSLGERAAERATGGGRRMLIGCGGEATVSLGSVAEFGAGGPNQEVALAAARSIRGLDVAAAFLDTDGSDGGTILAGAIADGASCDRAAAAGVDIAAALDRHRSGDAVKALRDGIGTGATHTNVNDLFAIAVG